MENKKIYNFIYSKKMKIKPNSNNLIIGKWLFTELLEKKKLNIVFYENNWINKKKQLQNFNKIKKIYVKVAKILSKYLNSYHSKKYNTRQWELIIYLFLYYYLSVVYDRWNLIKSIKKKYKLYPVKILSYNPSNFICENGTDVVDLIHSHEWNDWIISEIIKEQNIKHTFTKTLIKKNIFKRKLQKNKKKFFLRYKNIENKFFLQNFELPKYYKLKLNLSLGQFNFFYDVNDDKKIISKIKKLRNFKKINSKNNFINFFIKNLLVVLPKAFLENFAELEGKINNLNWPKTPKVIMTSYSHYNDEVFKIYAAQKIGNGTKLVFLQHGHQGHHELCGTYYEKRICDNYLSWGHKTNDNKTIPLFITTNIGKKITKSSPKGIKIKLTEFQLIPAKSSHAPRDIESVIHYKENIKFFLNKLNNQTRKITTIKSYDFMNLNFVTKDIRKNFRNIKIQKVTKLKARGFEDAYNQNLIVETFNSTGFIELLSMNSPVILLTTKSLFHVKKEYRKFYNVLIKNKIIFFNTEEAADHINLNLSKIDEWWHEKKRQKGIKFFCDNMCKYEGSNISQLSLILRKIANK